MEETKEIPRSRVFGAKTDYRSSVANLLMVMFIVLSPIGLGIALGSIGWGVLTLGITSGAAGYILGLD